jgi:hypothetical protein
LGRPRSSACWGVNAAARELGIDPDDASRATKVAGLSDEAKVVAKESGFDGNRSVLLKAAKAEDDVALQARDRQSGNAILN